jgi:hypothetical protein
MRRAGLLVVVIVLGCAGGEDRAAPVAQAAAELVLVEAELAQRMQQGAVPRDAFCEREVPLLELRGGALEARCGLEAFTDRVVEERVDGARRTLRTRDGRELVLQREGRQRYLVSGNPCAPRPTVHVEYPDARRYREAWLKAASCPTEDMKLAP